MCGKFNRRDAFAAILENGRVVAWGDPASSGDASRVEGSTDKCASRPIHEKCLRCYPRRWRVIAWGRPAHGGDCSIVQEFLTDVKEIQSTLTAFAAPAYCKISSLVQQIQSTSAACAAGGDCTLSEDKASPTISPLPWKMDWCGTLEAKIQVQGMLLLLYKR